jgi:disulfide bond formation protein DsbB
VALDQDTTSLEEKESEFSRGYFLLFGFGIGMFLTVVLAVSVLIATAPAPEAAPQPTVPTAGGESGDSGNGEQLFSQTCVACHGQGGVGIDGLGPTLIGNEFVGSLSDDDLVEFLNTGRPADHPDNESGITMPPKGGNPSLSDDDLADIAAYLRTLN